MAAGTCVRVCLEFSYGRNAGRCLFHVCSTGGAELLFDKVKRHDVTLPIESDKKWNIRGLLIWIKENLLKERPELFLQGDNVRPGILVLVNETDWELLGELDCEIQDGDRILFISTLHGG